MSDVSADEAIRAGAGLIDAGHRAVRATGSDATRFLHDLLTQDIAGLAVGDTAGSLLLAPNGRLRATMLVANTGNGFLLVSEVADHILQDLNRFRIRVDVELSMLDESALMLWGPAAGEVLGKAGWPLNPPSETTVGQMALPDSRVADRWFVFGDAASLVDAGAVVMEAQAAEAARIESGEPRFGVDVGTSSIPNEIGLLARDVDFVKGCYLGQELVERIDARGRLVKRLTSLEMSGDAVPPPDAEVLHAGEKVGAVTSAAVSPRIGVVAMAMLRTEAEAGSAVLVRWDGLEAGGMVRDRPLLTNS